MVTITDNSKGIDLEYLSRISETFFTTKPVGQGTGVGLSVSYNIVVERHGGQLRVESEQHQGTTFSVKLPLRSVAG